MICKNCQAEVELNYCANCGQPVKLKRINGSYIIHEIEHVLHLERGILFTIKELLIRPGQSVREFIFENRIRLVKPIIFIIVSSLIYSIVNHFFSIEDAYVNYGELEQSTAGAMMQWVQGHYGYANILMGIFIAFWTKLFFRKYDYNFFEILILLCFVMGIGMLIFAVFSLIQGVFHIDLLQMGGIIGFAYMTWAIGQFFDKSKVMSYVKAFLAYMVGMISFFLVLFALGGVIDMILKH